MSSRNNLVMLWKAPLHCFYFYFACIFGVPPAGVWVPHMEDEGLQGEQRPWATQLGSGAGEPSMRAQGILSVLNCSFCAGRPVLARLLSTPAVVQELLGSLSVGQHQHRVLAAINEWLRLPVITQDWAKLGLAVSDCRLGGLPTLPFAFTIPASWWSGRGWRAPLPNPGRFWWKGSPYCVGLGAFGRPAWGLLLLGCTLRPWPFFLASVSFLKK